MAVMAVLAMIVRKWFPCCWHLGLRAARHRLLLVVHSEGQQIQNAKAAGRATLPAGSFRRGALLPISSEGPDSRIDLGKKEASGHVQCKVLRTAERLVSPLDAGHAPMVLHLL